MLHIHDYSNNEQILLRAKKHLQQSPIELILMLSWVLGRNECVPL